MGKRRVSGEEGPNAFRRSCESFLRGAGLDKLVEIAACQLVELENRLSHGRPLQDVKAGVPDKNPTRKWYTHYEFTHGMFSGRYSANGDHVVILELEFHYDLLALALAA